MYEFGIAAAYIAAFIIILPLGALGILILPFIWYALYKYDEEHNPQTGKNRRRD